MLSWNYGKAHVHLPALLLPTSQRLSVSVTAWICKLSVARFPPYQLLVADELMWLAPHGPFQEQWQRFQEVLAQLSEDEGLRQRVGLLATSIIGTQETNARFSSTIYIPQDFPFSLQQQLAAEPWLERLVRKYRRGNLFIKRSGQDYRLFRAPFLSVSGPPSVPDLCWGP